MKVGIREEWLAARKALLTEEGRRTRKGFNFATAKYADLDLPETELHGLSGFALEEWPRRHDEYPD